jgi:IS5 family transposase
MIKMLLVGYLYGIRSERKLEEEITLNIAYRWFCGFDITDRIPDHSLFSQNRRRRFADNGLLREIFNTIVIRCIENGVVTGERVVSDGSFLPANVAVSSKVETVRQVQKSTVKYMDALDEELSGLPGYREPVDTTVEKIHLTSSTDPECGYIHQDLKRGLGYLAEMTVDTKHGIITGVDCYPANRRESDIILEHITKQIESTDIAIQAVGIDAGYDIGAVHRGFELLGITDYCCPREMHNNALKKGFTYCPESIRLNPSFCVNTKMA